MVRKSYKLIGILILLMAVFSLHTDNNTSETVNKTTDSTVVSKIDMLEFVDVPHGIANDTFRKIVLKSIKVIHPIGYPRVEYYPIEIAIVVQNDFNDQYLGRMSMYRYTIPKILGGDPGYTKINYGGGAFFRLPENDYPITGYLKVGDNGAWKQIFTIEGNTFTKTSNSENYKVTVPTIRTWTYDAFRSNLLRLSIEVNNHIKTK